MNLLHQSCIRPLARRQVAVYRGLLDQLPHALQLLLAGRWLQAQNRERGGADQKIDAAMQLPDLT
mgnify:CR=1 FL=1